MANLRNLKKVSINPLYNLGLNNLVAQYDATKTDEELVKNYHHILDCAEGSDLTTRMTYMMISYSVGQDGFPLYELMKETINHKPGAMQITFQNYKSVLPERLQPSFVKMADRAYGRSIIYVNGSLTFTL